MTPQVNTIEDLQKLVLSGYQRWRELGHIVVKEEGDLLHFTYTDSAQKRNPNKWKFVERISRGLILNSKTGEVVARPFDKAFNYNRQKQYGKIKLITEKIDGSLGILYRLDGQYKISTIKNLESKHAEWATNFLHKHYNLPYGDESILPSAYTMLFEIIKPDSQIILNYRGVKGLILLAIRNRFTGEYLPFNEVRRLGLIYRFETPTQCNSQFLDVSELIEECEAPIIDGLKEGYVVTFESGEQVKFKDTRYKLLHKTKANLTFKNVLECVSLNLNTYLADITNHNPQVIEWLKEIDEDVTDICRSVNDCFDAAPKRDKRLFASWVNHHAKNLAPYLFAKFDNRPIKPLIYKRGIKERKNKCQP